MDERPSLELMFRSALPIDDIDQLLFSPQEGVSIIWVNISERPDLQVLASQEQSQEGYSLCTWFYADPGKYNMVIGLRVDM